MRVQVHFDNADIRNLIKEHITRHSGIELKNPEVRFKVEDNGRGYADSIKIECDVTYYNHGA